MDKVRFLFAKEKDVKALAKLKQKAWEQTYRGIYPDEWIDNFDYDRHEAGFITAIKNKDVFQYKININGELTGYFCFGKPKRPYKDFKFCINTLYIKKEHQRKGIGKLVFSFIKKYCKKNNIGSFFVSCNYFNYPAQSFYEKMGGEKMGECTLGDRAEQQVFYNFII